MNQILLTNNINSNKKDSKKYNNNNSKDIKKIIIFFGIAILVFAILAIGIYAYKMMSSNKETTVGEPKVSLEEMDGQVKIIAEAEAGINQITYKWNDEEEQQIDMNGRTTHEEALDIPEGQNTLTVKVIDQNGKEIESTNEFYKEEDKEKPKLEIDEEVLTKTGKVKIIATDENNGLKYLTYQWNDEEEVKIDAESEDQTTIETTIDVKRGQNTLKIKCVNNLDNETTLEKPLKGVNEPKIEVTKDDAAGELYMTITHDMGFEKVEFTINGQEYVYDENFSGYSSEQTELTYKFKLQEGENTVIIHAVSLEQSEKTYKGKCNYSAQ